MKLTSLKCITLFVFCFSIMVVKAQKKYPSVLWEIKKTPKSKPSYLLGTYHVSKKSVFNIGDSMLMAIKAVDIVATEVNDNTWQHEDADFELMSNDYSKLGYRFGNSYLYEGTVRKTNTIEKLPTFISYQPDYINYFIYRNNPSFDGLEEETYLDMFITSTGYKFGKKIRGLEKYIDSKILYMQGLKDEEAQEKKDVKKIPGGMSYQELNDKIYDGYVNGSLDAMDSLNKYNYASDAFFKKFIVQRNYNQADSIHELIGLGNTVFAAVGSAHLPGTEGVIEILRRKGYTLRPVKVGKQNKEEVDKIKKIIAPIQVNQKQQIGNISLYAPGQLHTWTSLSLLTIDGYVDMANGAYYTLSKLVNNSAYFGKTAEQVTKAIDSLLYANIVGEIKDKVSGTHQGYPTIMVKSLVKNKDAERYKFIITPYEIFKLKVGGRSEYASQKNVDSFFNQVIINYTNTKKLAEQPFTLNIKEDYCITASALFDYYSRKTHVKNYVASNNQLNECTRILIQNNDLDKTVSLEQGLKESYFSSYMIKEKWTKDNLYKNIGKNYFENVPLEGGGKISVKFVFQYPFAYILSSTVANGKTILPDFVNSFAIKNKIETIGAYAFTDSNNAYKVVLPYNLNFNAPWKNETERIVKKPETKKELNRNDVLRYNYENPKQGSVLKSLAFQHPVTHEVVAGNIILIDSAAYMPSAAAFWTSLSKPNTNSSSRNRSSFDDDDDDEVRATTTSGSNNNRIESKEYFTNITYDTSNALIQSLSYINADSNSNTKSFVKYWLAHNKLYKLEAPVAADNKVSPEAEAIINSFAPLPNGAEINLYKSKLEKWFVNFTKAKTSDKADNLEYLNNIRLGENNLQTVQNIYAQLNAQTPENNILKRKLVDMVGLGYYPNQSWAKASAWLQNIYKNKTDLLTIRLQALEAILSKGNTVDAALVLNIINTDSILTNNVLANKIGDYLYEVHPKTSVVKAISLQKFDYSRKMLYLHDSSYFSTTEMLTAFEKIKKDLEAANYNTTLKAEKEMFKFKEDKDKVESKSYYDDNNFTNIIDLFEYFYALKPSDKFFDDMAKLIIENGTKTDKLDLLSAIVSKGKTTNTYTDKIVKQFDGDVNNYNRIYKIFYKMPKNMPKYLENKTLLAESYFRNDFSSYNKPDTLHFVKQVNSEIKPEETYYFFKYAPKGEVTEKIGYVVINNKDTNDKYPNVPDVNLTSEQENGEETIDELIKKLVRKNYFNNLLKMNNSRFYLDNKKEKGLDIND